ncbi:unnamed protein product, partial [Mesorhabditis spiculigera]
MFLHFLVFCLVYLAEAQSTFQQVTNETSVNFQSITVPGGFTSLRDAFQMCNSTQLCVYVRCCYYSAISEPLFKLGTIGGAETAADGCKTYEKHTTAGSCTNAKNGDPTEMKDDE